MAKQTINIGTAPNDGTGTPLRTAFDYCNLNFTELYTAVGPSGNNIVVPGTATITGDLTVDTSTLKVTASTDTVTVGTTTTDAKFRVIDANYNGLRIGFLPGTANYNLYDATVHEFRTANVTPQQLYTLQASSSVWYDGAGGTRMTLNSTGLAIGDTAFAGTRLTLRESASQPNALAMTNRNATQTWRLSVDTAAVDDKILGFYDSTSTAFRVQLYDTGHFVTTVPTTPPTLGLNSTAVWNLTSNTNLRVSVRGTDGTTRVANITLA
jgi:hypothetical protein